MVYVAIISFILGIIKFLLLESWSDKRKLENPEKFDDQVNQAGFFSLVGISLVILSLIRLYLNGM